MSSILDIPNPHKKNGKNVQIPPYRQLGAGPVNCSIEIMHAMMHQPITPINKYMFQMFDDIQVMTRYLYQTNNPLTLVAQVTGNGGNETLITNLADPGDTIVVASAGLWGDKVVNMGERYGLNVIKLTILPGEVYCFEELEEAISKYQAVTLFVTHGESSGGTLQPLDGLGHICHKYNCLLAVDAVVSVGVEPIFVDRWEIDAITGGSQKGLGAPSGLCLMTFSSRAHQRILNKKSPPPYIFDTLSLADVWNCFGNMRSYHYTYSSTLIAAVRQALIEICEEGLENTWERHRKASQLFLSKMDQLGVEIFVKKPENRFCGVNVVTLPKDVKWPKLLKYAMDKRTIEFSFGIGPTKDKELRNIRIGFLASNARSEIVEHFIKVLQDGIQYCREDETEVEKMISVQ